MFFPPRSRLHGLLPMHILPQLSLQTGSDDWQGSSFHMELQCLRQRQSQQKPLSPDSKRNPGAHGLPPEALPARPSRADSSNTQQSEHRTDAIRSSRTIAAADQAMTNEGPSSKLDLLSTAPEGMEQALRKLLVEPFATQAVMLMGQRCPIQLSPSEQATAISKTVDETATWAMAELARLQVAYFLIFMPLCFDCRVSQTR